MASMHYGQGPLHRSEAALSGTCDKQALELVTESLIQQSVQARQPQVLAQASLDCQVNRQHNWSGTCTSAGAAEGMTFAASLQGYP